MPQKVSAAEIIIGATSGSKFNGHGDFIKMAICAALMTGTELKSQLKKIQSVVGKKILDEKISIVVYDKDSKCNGCLMEMTESIELTVRNLHISIWASQ